MCGQGTCVRVRSAIVPLGKCRARAHFPLAYFYHICMSVPRGTPNSCKKNVMLSDAKQEMEFNYIF